MRNAPKVGIYCHAEVTTRQPHATRCLRPAPTTICLRSHAPIDPLSKRRVQELSVRRAESVRAALIALGISGDRISTEGYGEEHPVAKNDTAAHRQANRRVEIIFSEDNGNIPTM